MNINARNLKVRSNESKLSSNYILKISNLSKGTLQDELDTKKYKLLTEKHNFNIIKNKYMNTKRMNECNK